MKILRFLFILILSGASLYSSKLDSEIMLWSEEDFEQLLQQDKVDREVVAELKEINKKMKALFNEQAALELSNLGNQTKDRFSTDIKKSIDLLEYRIEKLGFPDFRK